MLNSDQFNQNEFDSLITMFKEHYKPDIKFLDFKYYNDYRRRLAKKEKMRFVRDQKFDEAAKCRILEKECMKYIEIKTEYKIEKSMFYYDQDFLFYFYLGKAKNDKIVRAILKL
mgnify:CR=1 FL=1